MNDVSKQALTKVPAVTLGFWVIKILATTLGETGGDTVTMTLNWGYAAGVALFGVALMVLVATQILAERFHPALYWATIVASTTFGTTLADFADRSLGIGYTRGFGYERGALVFTAALGVVVALYYWTTASHVTLFWGAFILTRPLGATVGDFVDKPIADGGLALSRPLASAVIAAVIVALLIVLPQRPGRHPGQVENPTAA
jgi:uncharacterized membrane-anchored protein